jgi:hypothetical protein
MNAPFPSDSSRQAPVSSGTSSGGRQTPSVPISVYRELATELKATQAMVDSLTQQNQQLSQQNQMLRHEMLNFVESADRLRQMVEYSQSPANPSVQTAETYGFSHQSSGGSPIAFGISSGLPADIEASSPSGRLGESMGSGISQLASHLGRLVTPKDDKAPQGQHPQDKRTQPRPKPPRPPQQLYTEERLEPAHSPQSSKGPADLSGLWLATTILLIVVSAFGAGFLIMKPLLNNSR